MVKPIVASMSAPAIPQASRWRNLCCATTGTVPSLSRVSFSNPLQLEPKVAHRLPAIFPIFGEAAADGVIQGRRSHGLNGANRRRILLEDRGSHAEWTLTVKSAPASEHFDRAPHPARICLSVHRPPGLPIVPAPCTGRCPPPFRVRSRADWWQACQKLAVGPGLAVAVGIALAKPKSISLVPFFVSMMLPGLRSRWTTPLRWAFSRPFADFDSDL